MEEKVIKVKEIVPPKDYNQLKTTVKALRKENENLRKLVSEGNFSDLENKIGRASCRERVSDDV